VSAFRAFLRERRWQVEAAIRALELEEKEIKRVESTLNRTVMMRRRGRISIIVQRVLKAFPSGFESVDDVAVAIAPECRLPISIGVLERVLSDLRKIGRLAPEGSWRLTPQ
jgi:hypothetical protein